jgi:hypothetical protein
MCLLQLEKDAFVAAAFRPANSCAQRGARAKAAATEPAPYYTRSRRLASTPCPVSRALVSYAASPM